MGVYTPHVEDDTQDLIYKAEVEKLTPEDLEFLDSIYIDLERAKKMEDLGKTIKTLRAEIKGLEADIKELSARKKIVTENMEEIRDIVLADMEAHGEEKEKFGTVRFRVVDQGACIVVKDPEAVYNYDPEYAKKEAKYVVDKECKAKLLETLLENGEVAQGTEVEFRKYIVTT